MRAADCGLVFGAAAPLNNDSETDSGDDVSPSLAAARGTWVVAWSSNSAPYRVVFARSADEGATWTSPTPLSDLGGSANPGLATDGSGGWVAIWTANGEARSARSIDDGVTWSASQALGAGRAGGRAAIATDRAGKWIVFWRSQDGANLLLSRSQDRGASWSAPETLANDPLPSGYGDPLGAIAAGPSGVWIAVWSVVYGGTMRFEVHLSRSTDGGLRWSAPALFSSRSSVLYLLGATLASDPGGAWIATWEGNHGGEFGPMPIVYRRSLDNGQTWSAERELSEPSAGDVEHHQSSIAIDDAGTAVATWYRRFSPSDANPEIYFTRSADRGVTWTSPAIVGGTNTDADDSPVVATDGRGGWGIVWRRTRGDRDLFFAGRRCTDGPAAAPYGTPLFDPRCARDSAELPGQPATFASVAFDVRRGQYDGFFVSRRGDGFEPLAVADALAIDDVDAGLGSATPQPGVPPFKLGAPVVCSITPVPAHDVTALIPLGASRVDFTLASTASPIYGNTALYLVRDCGTWLERAPSGVKLHYVSHRIDVEGQPGSLEIAAGRLSELRVDRSFSRACVAGRFAGQTAVTIDRSDPPVGDGDYYLVSGTCARPIGYGESSLDPDPRAALSSAPPCAQ